MIRICDSCSVGWGPSGRFLYVWFQPLGEMGGGKTIAIALPPGKDLPDLPAGGLKSAEGVKGINMVAEIDMKGKTIFAPGPDPSVYAYVRTSVQRNLYRMRSIAGLRRWMIGMLKHHSNHSKLELGA